MNKYRITKELKIDKFKSKETGLIGWRLDIGKGEGFEFFFEEDGFLKIDNKDKSIIFENPPHYQTLKKLGLIKVKGASIQGRETTPLNEIRNYADDLSLNYDFSIDLANRSPYQLLQLSTFLSRVMAAIIIDDDSCNLDKFNKEMYHKYSLSINFNKYTLYELSKINSILIKIVGLETKREIR